MFLFGRVGIINVKCTLAKLSSRHQFQIGPREKRKKTLLEFCVFLLS